jgi:hypothetical protein
MLLSVGSNRSLVDVNHAGCCLQVNGEMNNGIVLGEDDDLAIPELDRKISKLDATDNVEWSF